MMTVMGHTIMSLGIEFQAEEEVREDERSLTVALP